MVNQELIEYIKIQLKQGVSKENIINILRENNWPDENINEAFQILNSVNTTSPENASETSYTKQNSQQSQNNNSYQDKGKISRSFLLVKESWKILRQDKEIMWFPIISAITVLIINAVFVAITFSSGIFTEGSTNNNDYTIYGALFIFYIVAYFIVTFFNTGLITCANIRLNGGDPTFQDGINNAKKHVGKIFTWALFAATVGIVLQIISDKSKWLGKLIVSLLNLAWGLATFFIVPVIIFENHNIFDSVKESGSLFAKTWGENVVAQISMGIFFMLCSLLGIIPIGLALFTKNIAIVIITLIAVILFWMVLGIINASLKGIYTAALYNYARTGKVSPGYSPDVFQSAFAPKN